MKLHVVPCHRDEANAFIAQHHRHNDPVVGCKFAVAVATPGGCVVGVATAGRPISRHLDDGWTLEITRVCTDGTKNACSALYAACTRVAVAMGYRRVITYLLATEKGKSLQAHTPKWRCVAEVKGQTWNREDRPRVDKRPAQDKLRWELAL